MDLLALLDARGAAIVLGGTVLATLLGSGRNELKATAAAIFQLLQSPFNYDSARAEIARDVKRIQSDGILRATQSRSSDTEIAQATNAMIHDRSISSLIAEHEKWQQQRRDLRVSALRPIYLAGEMAPVFGMAGTLFSLSQLHAGEAQDLALMASVAMAIVTTLYGLLLAHLAFLPLARMVERRGGREDAGRQMLIEWLADQLAGSCPQSTRSKGKNPQFEVAA